LVDFRLKLLYQFSGTTIKCVWLRVAVMEMDCNLKNIRLLFSSFNFLCFLEKSRETMSVPPLRKSFDFLLLDVLGVFCVREKIFHPKTQKSPRRFPLTHKLGSIFSRLRESGFILLPTTCARRNAGAQNGWRSSWVHLPKSERTLAE